MGLGFAEFVPGMIEIWKKEGIESGRIEGKRLTIIKILTKKLNVEIDEETLELISNASTEEIDCIADNVFEITSWADIRKLIN